MSYFISVLKNEILDEDILLKLNELIMVINDDVTKSEMLELTKLHRCMENINSENVISIYEFIKNRMFEYDLSGVFKLFIIHLSNINYKLISMVFEYYIEKQEEYDNYNIGKFEFATAFNVILEKYGVEKLDDILSFDSNLNEFYWEKCFDIISLVKMRNKVDIISFINIVNYILENVDNKEKFLIKLFNSTIYKTKVTIQELNYFENIVNYINNDELNKKYISLRKKVEGK